MLHSTMRMSVWPLAFYCMTWGAWWGAAGGCFALQEEKDKVARMQVQRATTAYPERYSSAERSR
jgi:hypothetical protein